MWLQAGPADRVGELLGIPELPEAWQITQLVAVDARLFVDGVEHRPLKGHAKITMYINCVEGVLPGEDLPGEDLVCPVEIERGEGMLFSTFGRLAMRLEHGAVARLAWEVAGFAWSIDVQVKGDPVGLYAVEADGGLFKVARVP